ncbi:hypothetical protein [Streptomyces sp. NPDC050504]|uniref:hypothetical protein n=1 Tax=Streptomyces sp. NPDC050504 TaxID=3365618 RepID=UPI0037AD877D
MTKTDPNGSGATGPEPDGSGPTRSGATRPVPTDPVAAVAAWLASTAPAPDTAYEDWSASLGGVAFLPLGVHFDAVRIPIRLVRAVAGSEDDREIALALEELLSGGPVLSNGYRWYHALVPVGTKAAWTRTDAECVGEGTWLYVPHPAWTSCGIYWAVPPRRIGAACAARDVVRLLERARRAVGVER